MATLLLVRHGESEWNAAGRWQGWADPPLTDLGRRQAEVAAGHVGEVDVVASSDLLRARTTAELLRAGGAGQVVVDEGLRERDVGEWTGLTRAEIELRWPGRLGSFVTLGAPGGETTAQVLGRVVPALVRLAARNGVGRGLVVTHGGVIRMLEHHLRGSTSPVPNLCGMEVQVIGSELEVGPRVALVEAVEVPVTTPGAL